MSAVPPARNADGGRRIRRDVDRRAPARVVARRIVGASLVVAALLCVVVAGRLADLEAGVAGWWLSPLLPAEAVHHRNSVVFEVAAGRTVEFVVTIESTLAVLVAPLLALGGVILATTRVSWARIGGALGLSALLLFLTTQVRFGAVVLAVGVLGPVVGDEFTHRLLGSLVSIVGFSAAYLVFVVVIADLRLFRRHRSSGRGDRRHG